MTNNKTIIIIGALGQDGKILSKILINKGYKIFGIVIGNKKKQIKKVKYKKIELSNFQKIKKFIKKTKPSRIVQFGSKNPAFGEKDDFYKKNYISTKNIIDSIIEVNNKIIFIFPNSSFIFNKKKELYLSKINTKLLIHIQNLELKFLII